ncbi:MAG: gluconate 2-dehydrogenase subunit 3 family protein [Bacteroidetes bacterium]|jgi:hypothetical protein|nr:gluconate 2-dehydrogenase subunit 3 family protein [Bacteroidota bacterium]
MSSSLERPVAATAPDRRRFLKRSAFGVAALSVGGCLPGGPAGADDLRAGIAQQLRFSSPTEFLVLQAAAEQILDLPPTGGPMASADAAMRMDHYLAGADQEVQDQFHQLLSVFNSGLAAFFFDLRFSSFLGMSTKDRADYLQDWMESPIAFRRTAFVALKRIAASTYYAHPVSWKAIGYDADHTPQVRP